MKGFFVSAHLIPASPVLVMHECLGFRGEKDDILLSLYYCKLKNISPCIGEYVQRPKFNFEIEKQVSIVTGSKNKFQQNWYKLFHAPL